MRKIKIPDVGKKVKDIFKECAEDFTRKPNYTCIALKYIDDVEKCSDEYLNKVPFNINDLYLGSVDESDKIIFDKVYNQKFSKDKEVGRKYYDIIKANAKKVCPVCGCGTVKNLDHFLPISKYPLLCVAPINLIPTCRDCNMEKNSASSDDYYEIPFHPYLEEIKDVFLKCSISFYPDGSIDIEFFNGYSGDNNMRRKYNSHIETNGLDEHYSSEALCTIDSEKKAYRNYLEKGKKEVLTQLRIHKESADQRDINSWQSAFYCELCNKIDEFCDWLLTPDW